MNTQLIFKHLEKTEAIDNFARYRIEHVLQKFKKFLGTDKSTVRLSMLNAPTQAGADSFACEILVKAPHTKPFVIREVGDNLYNAVVSGSDRLFAVLSRWHERRTDRKRRHRQALKRAEPRI